MAQTVKTVFTVREAAKFAGLTMHMVDYLCRTRVLVPSLTPLRSRGRARQYSFGDVVMLRALAKFLTYGVHVSRLRESLIGLRKLHPEITPYALPANLLFTDGKRIYFKNHDELVEDLSRGQYVFGFLLELRQLRSEILANAQRKPARRTQRTGT